MCLYVAEQREWYGNMTETQRKQVSTTAWLRYKTEYKSGINQSTTSINQNTTQIKDCTSSLVFKDIKNITFLIFRWSYTSENKAMHSKNLPLSYVKSTKMCNKSGFASFFTFFYSCRAPHRHYDWGLVYLRWIYVHLWARLHREHSEKEKKKLTSSVIICVTLCNLLKINQTVT